LGFFFYDPWPLAIQYSLFVRVPCLQLELAQRLGQIGELDKAIEVLKSTTERRPNYAPAYIGLAMLSLTKNDPLAAYEALKQVQIYFLAHGN